MVNILLRLYRFLEQGLAKLQRLILILVSITVICSISLEVITRYLFDAPIWGMEEITGHTAVWLYMIGASYGTYDRSHIKAQFIHLIVKQPFVLGCFRILASVVSIVICIFMTIWSYEYVKWSLARHETTPALHWPTVYFQMPILISALLMTFYFFIELLDLVRNVQGHRTESIG